MLITQKWPTRLEYDPISAENFEKLMDVVGEVRRVMQEMGEFAKDQRPGLLYGDDSLVADNEVLLLAMTKCSSVANCEGQPRGLRLALANHEVYLDVSEEAVKGYRNRLEERILAVGRELDALNMRMLNPNYVDKAPVHLVKQTQDGIKEKTALIERLRGELEVIS